MPLIYLVGDLIVIIKKPIHVIGLVDGILHMVLVFLVFRNLKVILADRALRTILFVLFFYFLVFGIVVGNFGTAIRHRGKFVIMLILLIAPKIPKLFLKKNKLKESKALNNQPYSIERSK